MTDTDSIKHARESIRVNIPKSVADAGVSEIHEDRDAQEMEHRFKTMDTERNELEFQKLEREKIIKELEEKELKNAA
jgi:hypothetical protein